MTGSPFLWTLIACGSVLDLAGLFYLWRRRQKEEINRWRERNGADVRLHIPLRDRRQKERRGNSHSHPEQQILTQRVGSRARI
jgi:hypothetical protein